ncbi:MAG: hypothetical protein JNK26_02200 [Candidatus Doudnabacteria bacterium]|nr:hypothetical protein [Candidatus Doudnabacteria bacterium]
MLDSQLQKPESIAAELLSLLQKYSINEKGDIIVGPEGIEIAIVSLTNLEDGILLQTHQAKDSNLSNASIHAFPSEKISRTDIENVLKYFNAASIVDITPEEFLRSLCVFTFIRCIEEEHGISFTHLDIKSLRISFGSLFLNSYSNSSMKTVKKYLLHIYVELDDLNTDTLAGSREDGELKHWENVNGTSDQEIIARVTQYLRASDTIGNRPPQKSDHQLALLREMLTQEEKELIIINTKPYLEIMHGAEV